MTIPIKKPDKSKWFKVKPGWSKVLDTIKYDGKYYIIHQSISEQMKSDVESVNYHFGYYPDGSVFIIPVKNSSDEYSKTFSGVIKDAETKWMRFSSYALNDIEAHTTTEPIPEPEFDEKMKFEDYLKDAFKNNMIKTLDHEVIKYLSGAKIPMNHSIQPYKVKFEMEITKGAMCVSGNSAVSEDDIKNIIRYYLSNLQQNMVEIAKKVVKHCKGSMDNDKIISLYKEVFDEKSKYDTEYFGYTSTHPVKVEELDKLYTTTDNGDIIVDYMQTANYIINKLNVSSFDGDVYVYSDGVYSNDAKNRKKIIIPHTISDTLKNIGFSGLYSITKAQREINTWVDTTCPIYKEYPFNNIENAINVNNGVVVYKDNGSFEFVPHDKKYNFTWKLPVNFDPDADTSKPEEFFDNFGNNKDLLLQVAAQALIMQMKRQHNFKKGYIIIGESNCGKSTIVDLFIKYILGESNISTEPLHAICGDKFAGASIVGKIANIYDDLPDTDVDMGRFKALLGGVPVSVEAKFVQSFSYRNSALMVFTSNEYPNVNNADEAFWNRWIQITLDKVFPIDEGFKERVFTPEFISGVFNLILKKISEIIKNNYKLDGVDTWMDFRFRCNYENDIIGRWIKEHVEDCEDAVITKKSAYKEFHKYLIEKGVNYKEIDKLYGMINFGSRMSACGYGKSSPEERNRYVVGKEFADVWMNAKWVGKDPIYPNNYHQIDNSVQQPFDAEEFGIKQTSVKSIA